MSPRAKMKETLWCFFETLPSDSWFFILGETGCLLVVALVIVTAKNAGGMEKMTSAAEDLLQRSLAGDSD